MYKPKEVILGTQFLKQRMYEWQRRLRLQDWIIDLKLERGFVMGELIGKVQPYTHNKRAVISLLDPEDYSPTDLLPYDMECVLIHELLHLHFWPLTKRDGENEFEEQAINAIAEALIALDRYDVGGEKYDNHANTVSNDSNNVPDSVGPGDDHGKS